jgi:hypothetical protein
MNAGEALNLLLRRVGDPNGDRLGPAEAMSLIDQGTLAFQRETKILRQDGVALVADGAREPGYAFYLRPDDLWEVDEVEYEGDVLDFITPAQLRRRYTNWRTESGTPLYYLLDTTHLRAAPYPAAAATIYMDYFRIPQSAGALGSIDLPTIYELAPVSWAAAEWLTQNSDRRESDMIAGYLGEYMQMAERAKGTASNRGSAGVRRLGTRAR